MDKPFVKGRWLVLCDRCGFKRYNTEVIETWDHLWVCRPEVKQGCYEPRHPQDFVRAVPDKQNVPFTRPERVSETFRADEPAVNCSVKEPQPLPMNPVTVSITVFKGYVKGPLIIESGVSMTIHCSLEIT